MQTARLGAIGMLLLCAGCAGAPPAEPYPLTPEMTLLERDASSPEFRGSLEKFHFNDLHNEWQRAFDADGPDEFLKAHGGLEKVAAHPDASAAYERRRKAADLFLDALRAEYARRKLKPPFDEGARVETDKLKAFVRADDTLEIVPILPAPGAEKEWSRWRGPDGQGVSLETGVPAEWRWAPEGSKSILWRTAIPGEGNSSPILWGDRIFLTSAFDSGHRRSLVCVQRSDGRLLFVKEAPEVPPEGRVMAKNGWASATPVADGERVYCFFGNTGLVAFDFEGNVLWHRPLAPFDAMHGTGASPAVAGDLVILLQEQSSKPSVGVAVDKKTGEVRWQVERAPALGWCTPLPLRINGREQLVYGSTSSLGAIDLRTGREIWRCAGPTIEVVPTPVYGHGLVYCSSGRNGPTIAVRPDGEGDVTSSKLAWRVVRGAPHVPSPIVLNGLLLQVNDTGVLSCIDARTGETVYQKRLEGRYSASPVAAEGRVYFTNEDGETFAVRASREHELVATSSVGEPVLASPAIHGGRIFIRGRQHLFAIGER